jgi:hypothetical protein
MLRFLLYPSPRHSSGAASYVGMPVVYSDRAGSAFNVLPTVEHSSTSLMRRSGSESTDLYGRMIRAESDVGGVWSSVKEQKAS